MLYLKIAPKLKIGGFEKLSFLSPPILQFLFRFFIIHPHENQAQIMGWHGWDSTYMITMISSKLLGFHINLLHSVQMKHFSNRMGNSFGHLGMLLHTTTGSQVNQIILETAV